MVQMLQMSRDGFQGVEKSLETGENENSYAYVHVPMEGIPGFYQILEDVSSLSPSPLKSLGITARKNPERWPLRTQRTRRNQAELGEIEERARLSVQS